MNIIFLTLYRIPDISEKDIYNDLLRKFRDDGHHVYVVTPRERRFRKPTEVTVQEGIHILGVRTLNIQKTNIVEKGIGTILVERQYKPAIKKHFGGISFDLILYSTPPVTFPGVIASLRRSAPSAVTYLLLKDIFPQNAVDLGMFTSRSLIFQYFRRKEKRLYALSDFIGCMSPANVKYLLEHNPEISPDRVEENPNCLDIDAPGIQDMDTFRRETRSRYHVPMDRTVFVYGGNLGKPQGIDFLIQALQAVSSRKDCWFLIVGDGTEYPKIQNWVDTSHPANVSLLKRLPQDEYDALVRSCDVGMICLDHRFTIPNFPSRILSYMEFGMPVVSATDPNTDIGRISEENGFGYWCESDSIEDFSAMIDKMCSSDRVGMGRKSYEYMRDRYCIQRNVDTIMKHLP